MKYFALIALGLLFSTVDPSSLRAEETLPSRSITPSACAAAQSCVDTAITSVVDTCVVETGCSPASNFGQDPFALSAGTLAARALALKHCETKTSRLACNFCYEAAIQPLRIRFDQQLLHGLFANAVLIVKEQKRSICGALPR